MIAERPRNWDMSPPTELPSEDAPRTYRLTRIHLVIGIVCVSFFLLMGVLSVLFSLFVLDKPAPQRLQAAWFFGIFWGLFMLLGLYILVAYLRTRIMISAESITVQTPFRDGTVKMEDVRQISWKIIPAMGRVVIHSNFSRLTIGLGGYHPHDRDELIEFFRTRFDAGMQEGWDQFVRRMTAHA